MFLQFYRWNIIHSQSYLKSCCRRKGATISIDTINVLHKMNKLEDSINICYKQAIWNEDLPKKDESAIPIPRKLDALLKMLQSWTAIKNINLDITLHLPLPGK